MALSPPTYVKDEQGATFIAASQRPDGTWRKPRRVRDGYIPQEEVPIYESKGKLFAKSKPQYPVGMTEEYVNIHKGKKENFEKSPISGILVETPSEVKLKKKKRKKKTDGVDVINEGLSKAVINLEKPIHKAADNGKVSAVQDPQINVAASLDPSKRMKNLRKKLREIEAIEEKITLGELKALEKEQLEKVARKRDVLSEMEQLSVLLKSK